MRSKYPQNLEFPRQALDEEWPFMPESGCSYTLKDKERCMKQQPIDVGGEHQKLVSFLHTLKGVSPDQDVQPPVLHFGWKFTEAEVLDILCKKFPDYVLKLAGTEAQLSCVDLADFTPDPSNREWLVRESAYASLFGPELIHIIRNRIKVRRAIAPLVAFRIVRDGNQGYYAVTVGDNYHGVVNPAARAALCELLELDAKGGMWFLDVNAWFWRQRDKERTQRRIIHRGKKSTASSSSGLSVPA